MTSATTQTIGVSNNDWQINYTGDPTLPAAVAGSTTTYIIAPCDYNPYQTGVASTCPASVNTNQYEFINIAFIPGEQGIISSRPAGGTAPSGTAWPAGSIMRRWIANIISGNQDVNIQRFATNIVGSSNGYFNFICNDAGPNPCAQVVVGTLFNDGVLNELGRDTVGPNNLVLRNFQPNVNPQNGLAPLYGSGCVKLMAASGLTLEGSTQFQTTMNSLNVQGIPGPGIANGVAAQGLSSCVIIPTHPNNGAPFIPSAFVMDEASNSTYSCVDGVVGHCSIQSGLQLGTPGTGAVGGPSPGQQLFRGTGFSISSDQVDTAGFTTTAPITAWSVNAINGAATVSLTLTLSSSAIVPLTGSCVGISGLVAGAVFNTTTYGTCDAVTAKLSPTSFTVTAFSQSNILPANTPLSATEAGTATLYMPGMRANVQGGPTLTGVNSGWDWDFWTGSAWSPAFSIRQTATAGNAIATFPGTTDTEIAFPVTIGNLSNLAINSQNYSAGSWTLGSTTIGATGQPGPLGFGNVATRFDFTSASTLITDSSATFPLTANTLYMACAWMMGTGGATGAGWNFSIGRMPSATPFAINGIWRYN